MVDSYQDVRNALDAVVRNQAIPEAYSVIERLGWKELVPGIIYRRENWMDIKIAREIITRAKKDDVYDGDMPEAESEAITAAEEIVTLAEQAWSQNIRGPEVESILKLAAQGGNGSEPEAEAEQETGDEHAPPEEEPTRTLQGASTAKLQKTEPWEGYGDGTVKDIVEGINYFLDDDPNSALDILEHVHAFEKSHKDRARILSHVEEAYKTAGGSIATEEEEATGEATDESDAEGQSDDSGTDSEGTEAPAEDEGDEGGIEGGSEGDSPEAESDENVSSDAESDSEPEIGKESSEGNSDEAKSSGSDKKRGSDRGPSAYQKLIQKSEEDLKRERLDVPKPPEETAPDLPWNWNEISDADLRELHMRYSVCAYYKRYRVSLHNRVALHAKAAADELHSAKMRQIDKYDDKGKEKKVGLIEAEIAGDDNVRRWRQIQRKHEQLSAADKQELEAYDKIVESLSRLETMRHNAWERARR